MRTLIIILFALVACKKEIADDGNILFIDGVEVGRYGQWHTCFGHCADISETNKGPYTTLSGDSIRYTFEASDAKHGMWYSQSHFYGCRCGETIAIRGKISRALRVKYGDDKDRKIYEWINAGHKGQIISDGEVRLIEMVWKPRRLTK